MRKWESDKVVKNKYQYDYDCWLWIWSLNVNKLFIENVALHKIIKFKV